MKIQDNLGFPYSVTEEREDEHGFLTITPSLGGAIFLGQDEARELAMVLMRWTTTGTLKYTNTNAGVRKFWAEREL